MNVTQANYRLKSEFDVNNYDTQKDQLKSEKKWVDNLVEAQRTENDWQIQKKADIINDLR